MSGCGSKSSFGVIDDNSSVSSMEIVDNVKVDGSDDSERNVSDSLFEEKALETSDVRVTSVSQPEETGPVEKTSDGKETSESSSGDVVKPNEPAEKSPMNLEGSDATTNSWRDQVSMALRHHLVRKLVLAILNGETCDDDDDRRKEVIDFSRRKENECFEKGGNEQEYYRLLAGFIYKAQKEQKQKAQDRNVKEPQVAQKEKQPGGAEEQIPKRTAENRAGSPIPSEPGLLEDLPNVQNERRQDKDQHADHVVTEKKRKAANDEVGEETSRSSADLTPSKLQKLS